MRSKKSERRDRDGASNAIQGLKGVLMQMCSVMMAGIIGDCDPGDEMMSGDDPAPANDPQTRV